MKISRPIAFSVGAVMALVLGSGTAFAATGGKFVLGKSNSATSTTTLKNTKGPALQLTSKSGTPSLKVSSTAKVPNLNADRVDGIDSSALALAAGQTNTVEGIALPLDVNDDGISDFMASIATCPSGTKLTGGGGDDYTSDGALFVNSPLDKKTWLVTSTTSDMSAFDDVLAYAVCYNPRGSIFNGSFRAAPAKPDAETLEIVKTRLAKKLD